ncbi:MAG: hypothetical protein WC756_09950 [Taibaiella sp.]|jgi:hypothetical protein
MKKTVLKLTLTTLLAYTGSLTLSAPATAQIIIDATSLSYLQDFNTLDTTSTNSANLPLGWQIFEYGTSSAVNNEYKGNSGTSTMGDVYSYGSAGSMDRALGSLGTSGNKSFYGATFQNNTGLTITSIAVHYRGEQWRRGTSSSDTLLFRYSYTANNIADTLSSKWIVYNNLTLTTIYTGTPTNTALDGNATGKYALIADTLQVNILPGDSILIEWLDKDATGSDEGLAVDDLSLTFITDLPPIPTHIYVMDKSPTGADISPATDSLSIKFDHLITEGTGQISLYKKGSLVPAIFTVPSAQIIIADSTVIIKNVLLENNSQYYVLMTAGTFTKAGDTIPSLAITDTTFWTFATADTIVPVPPAPLTTLNESFKECADSVMGIFRSYNVEGFKTWRCSVFGHNGDSSSVSMSGGIVDGLSAENADWLISKLPFDFSAMSRPELSFWQKSRFAGNVSRTIKISSDYVSGNNPATANWTTLQVQDMIDDPLEDWTPVADIDLAPYKNVPFFLAFTYSCGTNGAYELIYDDIKVIDETLSVQTLQHDRLQLQIVGEATGDAINLAITHYKNATFSLNIFDLAGKNLYKGQLSIKPGKEIYSVKNAGLKPGMYIIRINNGENYGVVKAFIR